MERDLAATAIEMRSTRVAGGVGSTKRARPMFEIAVGGGATGSVDITNSKIPKTKGGKAVEAEVAAGGGAMGSKTEISPEELKAYKEQEERNADMAVARFQAEWAALRKASGKGNLELPPLTKLKAKAEKPSPTWEIKDNKVKVDQAVIDLFERNPIQPLSPSYNDPELAALVQMQIDNEKHIVKQCRENDGYLDLAS